MRKVPLFGGYRLKYVLVAALKTPFQIQYIKVLPWGRSDSTYHNHIGHVSLAGRSAHSGTDMFHYLVPVPIRVPPAPGTCLNMIIYK